MEKLFITAVQSFDPVPNGPKPRLAWTVVIEASDEYSIEPLVRTLMGEISSKRLTRFRVHRAQADNSPAREIDVYLEGGNAVGRVWAREGVPPKEVWDDIPASPYEIVDVRVGLDYNRLQTGVE